MLKRPLQSSSSSQPAQSSSLHLTVTTRSNLFYRLHSAGWSLLALSLKRLRYHLGLSLLSLLGVILAIGLVSSAAFFSQAVETVIMRQELADYSKATQRPPFSSRVFSSSTRSVPLTLERSETLASDVADTLASEVGLPVRAQGMAVDSGVLTLQRQAGDTRYEGKKSLGNVGVIYLKDVGPHLQITDGQPLDEGQSGEALDVWMHADQAAKLGMQIGDKFDLQNNQSDALIPVRMAGFWRAANPKDEFWFSDPDQTLKEKLFVRRSDYLSRLEPYLTVKVRAVTWYVVLDESQTRPSRARDYAEGWTRAAIVIKKYLPEAQLTLPSVPLAQFIGRQTTLTTLLLGFNVPALGFLLYFLILTSAVVAYWQRRETAILISRGMTRWGVLGFTLVEGLLLFAIALPVGLAFGMALARLMGYTVSFLSFRSRTALPVSLDGINIPLLAATLTILLIAKLWTALLSSRETVLAQEREHARPPRGPFWYRTYLDLILLIPTFYGYRQLLNRGSLGQLVREHPEDLYQDPLLIIVPALFVVVSALLAMRLFPWVMRLLDWLAKPIPWLTPHLALRQLGRYSQNYINPLLLVIVALALGVYTLSMAASLDQWLLDRIYYRIGADLTFSPYSEAVAMADPPVVGADWVPPPDEFRHLPGVIDVARVGDYEAYITLAAGDNKVKGRFIGVDRVDFSRVAWFRSDLAHESLGALMNRLAAQDEGVLVAQQFLTDHHLNVGDKLTIHVLTDFGVSLESDFTVVGVYEHFPTVYEDKITVVGNLEYLFSFFGLTMPHRIWMHLQPGTNGKTVLKKEVPITGIGTISEEDTTQLINDEQAKMERVGVFGTLSVGFVASAFMAALGLLTYSYASLHERMYLFSVMRAIGMRRPEILSQVGLEYLFLTAYGALAGVMGGSMAASLFVPLFRVTGEKGIPQPPLLPIIAQEQIWPLVIAFAAIMVVLELVVISGAIYQRLSRALRLGH